MMKIGLRREDLDSNKRQGLEISVEGYMGDGGQVPTQVFIEYHDGQLAVHVWDGTAEYPITHIIGELDQSVRKGAN